MDENLQKPSQLHEINAHDSKVVLMLCQKFAQF